MDKPQILEQIKQIKTRDVNLEKLREYFDKLTSREIEVTLDFIKNLDFYKLKIENFDLQNDEVVRVVLINLALKNEIRNNFEEHKKVEIEFLKTIDSLESEIKDKAIKVYISKGLHILKLGNNHDEFKYKTLILKHFHDLGGFETGLWGIRINFDLFLNLLKEMDYSLIEKLENKTKVLTKDSFVMLLNLFY